MSDNTTNKSAGHLLSDVMSNVGGLVRNEVDLARAEISENVTKAGVALGLIAGAAIIALVALNVLAAALVAALTDIGLEAGWSSLIVGTALGIIAFALISKGVNDLKLSSLAPTRTVKNVQRDAAAVKDAYDDK
ncbi:phage holin family protein [uncultured Roseobacter sp.]|uniref:phage holin family protein n=1 Tax=uncultured Roseobacter sp. TaxID=114847 RepID=UPI00263903DA|nr:phage holin family protein [uncultured Roseobacter sp.]